MGAGEACAAIKAEARSSAPTISVFGCRRASPQICRASGPQPYEHDPQAPELFRKLGTWAARAAGQPGAPWTQPIQTETLLKHGSHRRRLSDR